MQDNNRYNQDEWIRKEEANKKLKGVVLLSGIFAIFVGIAFSLFLAGMKIDITSRGYKIEFGRSKTEEKVTEENKDDKEVEVEVDKLAELNERLKTIYNRIYDYYDGEVDDKVLFDGASKGMVEALGDPYSAYLNTEDYARLTQETSGSYVGLGIYVGVLEDRVVVISPFEDSPADKAGMLPGDIINKVNGLEIGKDIDKAVGIMKGEKGGVVKINIIREGVEPFDLEVTRDEIKMKSVSGEMIEDGIGYIRLSGFLATSAEDFRNKLTELKKEGAKGIILDLRGNPGGLVSACVAIASEFIPKNDTIVYTLDKYEEKYVYRSRGGIAEGMPLVVLINEGSASASEILSGALRDYKRATLIGEKSFGKGIVQTILDRKRDGFGNGTGLKLTVSSYYTPNGENIHKKGIEPEILIELDEEVLRREGRDKDSQFKKALEVIKEKVQK